MTKVGGIRKIMFLWQGLFLAASPLVTAPPSNLTLLYYNGSAGISHSTTTQYRQLRRLGQFQPSWFTGCRLGVENVPSTWPDFHFEKTGEKDFWWRITHDEILTDYTCNTKVVNYVDSYRRRDNNSDKAGKVKNETWQQMNNLFQRLCSVRSFLL